MLLHWARLKGRCQLAQPYNDMAAVIVGRERQRCIDDSARSSLVRRLTFGLSEIKIAETYLLSSSAQQGLKGRFGASHQKEPYLLWKKPSNTVLCCINIIPVHYGS